jgi:hypothetical protein
MEDLEQEVGDILDQEPTLKEEIDKIMGDENKTNEEKEDSLKDLVDRNDEGLTEQEKEQMKNDIEDILNQKPTLEEEIDRVMGDETKTDAEKEDTLKDIVDRNDEGLTEQEKEQIKENIENIMKDPNKSDEEKKDELLDAMKPVEDNYNNQTDATYAYTKQVKAFLPISAVTNWEIGKNYVYNLLLSADVNAIFFTTPTISDWGGSSVGSIIIQ